MFRQILTLAGLGLLLALCAGCGSDDGGTKPPPVQSIRVVVADAATAPSLTSVDDPLWTGITPTQIDINTPDVIVSSVESLSDSIKIQALRQNNNLWIRLQWRDNSHSMWRSAYEVDSVNPNCTGSQPCVRFKHNTLTMIEDQAIVAFAGLGPNMWDAWNWRVLTTGAGLLAEDMILRYDTAGPSVDTFALVGDAVPDVLQGPAYLNGIFPELPEYFHPDSSEYHGYLLYLGEWLPATPMSKGWVKGQLVPGYYIDTSFAGPTKADLRGSRWDVRAIDRYDSASGTYTVVMMAPMNTGYTDDINFLTKDSVQTQVGLLDNSLYEKGGSSKKGFTKKFWLVL